MKYDIAIIDSGLGGINLFEYFNKNLPFKKYIYFADLKNLPYGNKTTKQLLEITAKNINFLIKKYNVKIIIFGCNTISLNIYNEIKNKFNNLKIYALKPNLNLYLKRYRKILFLGTIRTIKKIMTLADYKANKNRISLMQFKELANKIEKCMQNNEDIVPYLHKCLRHVNNFQDYDCVILACTHYIFIQSEFKKIFKFAKFENNIDNLMIEIKEDYRTYLDINSSIINPKVKFILTSQDYKKKNYERLLKDIFL